ncbi:malectin domain-containing carbohydrate-binding protein [Hymenobacter volaticus]|uniref:Malectin domain-containing carbohydrate-binding protein n=1 Tax=Hymenobacter volaticus TaxID=2932254 RepID=A0ABY4GCW3_9BACT|nr:malectin domain-containing carbohydrate-binding protein [Hymenobacter volaticus]UOQ68636.1 malectin domain-containing carbohydrate-binding protein [Hymenobacter volaticus]
MRKLFTSWALVHLLSALLLTWLPAAAWAQTWTTIAPTGTPRWVGFSVMINNKMYVFSGFDNPEVHTTAKCEVYTPTTNTWSYIADMPYPVTHAGITVDGTKVYVAGGFLGGLGGDPNSDLLQIYDVNTNSWSFGPKLPTRSGGNQLVRVGRKLHSFGGMLDDRQTGATAHYVLDLSNTAAGWTTAASMPVPRCHFASANVGGKIYTFGGQTGHDGPIEDVDVVQMYDPSTDTWTQLKNMPYVRSHSEPGTFVLDGKVTLVGGRSGRINGTDVVLNRVTTYDPATDSWTEKTPLPVNLFGPAAEVIGSELFVADGGLNQSTNPQTTARKIGWTSTPINRIGFLPSTLNLSAAVGATATKEALLWTLSGTPSYTIDPSTLPAWLSVSPTSGTVDLLGGTEIKVTATATTVGSYSATVTAKAAGYPDATLTVNFNVTASKPQVLYLYGSIPPSIHDMKLSDTGDRGMSQFNQVLLDAGFSTTQNLDASVTLDAATLNKYKVLILSSNNRRFTAAERTAVANWVNAGGGLIAWSDAAFGWENGGLNSSEGSVSDNDLTQQFGMQFLHDNGAPVFTLNQWAVNHYLNKFNKNAGVTIEAEGASPIRTSAPATILAYLPAAQAYLNSQDGNITSADAALAVAKVGQGRVLGCFDRNAFWNNGEGTFLSRAENRIFAQRLVLWASGVDDSTTPTANAGPNKAITLPTNSTTLNGSGFDDGPIASYTWTQVSGPNNATFSSKTVAQPTVSGLVAGVYVFSLVVTDNSGQSSAASQTTVTVNPAGVGGTPLYRIHAAGGALNTSTGAFAADQYYNGNSQTYGNTNPIGGTEDDALYQAERYGTAFGYAFPVSSGQQYRVVLHFAEIYATTVGQRVFDVSLEGNKVLDNYDIFKKVGTNVATTETFTTTVADDVLNLNFSSLAADGGVDNAKVSAIEVYRLSQGSNQPPWPTLALTRPLRYQ